MGGEGEKTEARKTGMQGRGSNRVQAGEERALDGDRKFSRK